MKRDYLITQSLLKQLLDYNPDTGELTWKYRDRKFFNNVSSYRSWNKRYSNKKAGGLDKRGGITLKIFDKSMSAPRVIYMLYYGVVPNSPVTYKNNDKLDLRLENIGFD